MGLSVALGAAARFGFTIFVVGGSLIALLSCSSSSSILALQHTTIRVQQLPSWRQRLRTIPAMRDENQVEQHATNSDDDSFLPPLDEIATYSSSLERFAASMHMSLDEVAVVRQEYERAAAALHENLQDPTLSGTTKHQLHCRHRYDHGRQPFVCLACWSYLPICLCQKKKDTTCSSIQPAAQLLFTTSVIIWTHHKEWGSPSNTGSVLSVAPHQLLGNNVKCKMLLKGLAEHDAALQQALEPCSHRTNERVIPVVLWTENDNTNTTTTPTSSSASGDQERRRTVVTAQQLNDELVLLSSQEIPVRFVLIAVEGTWSHARRMVTKLPARIRALHLTEHELFAWQQQQQRRRNTAVAATSSSPEQQQRQHFKQSANNNTSLLHPLRKQKKLHATAAAAAATTDSSGAAISVVNTHKVCTVEAVVGALVALHALSDRQAESILESARRKVTQTAAYQGKVGICPEM